MKLDRFVRRLTTELFEPEEVSRVAAPQSEPYGIIGNDAEAPFVMVPLAHRRAAAASLLRWTDATTRADVAKRVSAGAAFRLGVGRLSVGGTVYIRTSGTRNPTFHDHLARSLGERSVRISATFGPPRPNQKPVVRVFAGSGATIAFAKIGWNDLTRRLVEREAGFLAARRPSRFVVTPSLLFRSRFQDKSIAAAEALTGSAPIRRPGPPTVEMIDEVASSSDRYSAPLVKTGRREDLGDTGSADSHGVEAAALSLIDERWGDLVVPIGHWHGDWAPWNMLHDGRRLIVWDWERHAPDVPVGLDVIHYEYQTRAARRGRDLATVLEGAAASRPTLRALGVPPEAEPALALYYLVEMHRRFARPGSDAPEAARAHARGAEELLMAATRHYSR